MIDINFAMLLSCEALLENIRERLSDYTGFWRDYLAPRAFQEIEAIFETEGHRTWVPLSPEYAAEKARTHPGQDILQREGDYFQAATSPDHPANQFLLEPGYMVLGIQGSRFEEGYPDFHETGTEHLPARPVYELIPTGRFESEIHQLGEQWAQTEIEKQGQRGNV